MLQSVLIIHRVLVNLILLEFTVFCKLQGIMIIPLQVASLAQLLPPRHLRE